MPQFIKHTLSDGRVDYHNLRFISQASYEPTRQRIEITLGDPATDDYVSFFISGNDATEARKILEQAAKFKE